MPRCRLLFLAIEDKLQQYVPQTIKRLREAGIAFWMLTGDKYEACAIFFERTSFWMSAFFGHAISPP